MYDLGRSMYDLDRCNCCQVVLAAVKSTASLPTVATIICAAHQCFMCHGEDLCHCLKHLHAAGQSWASTSPLQVLVACAKSYIYILNANLQCWSDLSVTCTTAAALRESHV